MQILADFEVKYLPLPERYDINFNVSLSLNVSFLKSIEKIFGHCCLFASGAIWKLRVEQAYFNFIRFVIQGSSVL